MTLAVNQAGKALTVQGPYRPPLDGAFPRLIRPRALAWTSAPRCSHLFMVTPSIIAETPPDTPVASHCVAYHCNCSICVLQARERGIWKSEEKKILHRCLTLWGDHRAGNEIDRPHASFTRRADPLPLRRDRPLSAHGSSPVRP